MSMTHAPAGNHPPQARRRQRSTPTRSTHFIGGLTSGRVSEGQAAAFAMAVFFRGLSVAERVALTRAMTHSGEVLTWDLPGPVLDKHSTGGVGDNGEPRAGAGASRPAAAIVPMISGRGLGHTGGTLDKLDAIPGYVSQPDIDAVPARRRARPAAPSSARPPISRPPTSASTRSATSPRRSKSIDAHHRLDPVEEARGRARRPRHGRQDRLRRLHGRRSRTPRRWPKAWSASRTAPGCRRGRCITDMNEPLASAAGNARRDRQCGRLSDRPSARAALARGRRSRSAPRCSRSAGLAADIEEGARADREAHRLRRGRRALRSAWWWRSAAPTDFLERPRRAICRGASVARRCQAGRRGFVTAIDTRALGVAVVGLGGGRTRPQDAIDPAVGLTDLAGIGAGGRSSSGRSPSCMRASDAGGRGRHGEPARLLYASADEAPRPTSHRHLTSRKAQGP